MIYYLLNAAGLGLAAGLSPGPLMTLIIAESLRDGLPAGFRVSLAPLVTDSVLVSLALLVAAPMPDWGLSAISVVGGAIILWMGWGTIRSAAPAATQAAAAAMAGGGEAPVAARGALSRGIATNLLNPQAFLFWLTVGGPMLKDAFTRYGAAGPVSFMAAFFTVMISINLVIAFSIARGRHLLQGEGYRWTLRLAGLMLAGLGVWRLWVGAQGLMPFFF
jgi:threonine/homoserine/homoserine lactone efflux protein